jgi:dihydroorotate dehydrogenase (NAD+) catalytic subunit
VTGGLSGPAIKPVAIAKVLEISRQVDIPIIGIGGIMDWRDVIEFMIAGSSAVQIGTLNFIDPSAPGKIITQMEDYCINNKVEKISSLIASYQL